MMRKTPPKKVNPYSLKMGDVVYHPIYHKGTVAQPISKANGLLVSFGGYILWDSEFDVNLLFSEPVKIDYAEEAANRIEEERKQAEEILLYKSATEKALKGLLLFIGIAVIIIISLLIKIHINGN